ncbi:Uncharacterised protein [Salmonella enterica subsp. diarizonae]|uniref:Uncharacterized protein n=1 Tax=Salmonella diarizonae TaxID=59204 RepID=A0A379U1Q0_SALDZ|nr:Uncharacterised protein [Salmonella enterica subsp. diarizonae]
MKFTSVRPVKSSVSWNTIGRHISTSPVTMKPLQSRLFAGALKRAQQLHGFDNDTDQQALALDCLRLHPELDMHPG